MLARGEKKQRVLDWAAEHGHSTTRPTLNKHVGHITDPKTTFVEEARKHPAIKRVSHQDFLETLVSIGADRAESQPDSVTLDHSIRAAQILVTTKEKHQDVLVLIARAIRGTPVEVIDVEYSEVPAEEAKLLD